MMESVFWISLVLVYYVYDGYLRLLQGFSLLVSVRSSEEDTEDGFWPFLTVLLTVHNEEKGIAGKLDNILAQQYAEQKVEILVASDGSTDSTDAIVEEYSRRFPNITLFRPKVRKGKTDTQNQAIARARGEIVVFTDCDTSFATDFLSSLVRPFFRDKVGCTTGEIMFMCERNNNISSTQSYYWRYETRLRRLESSLGILAVASGACMAVRKELFHPMEAAYGEDCIVPLDVVSQGFEVVHVADAIAHDRMPATSAGEFRTRVRMTLRNWQGTWSRADLLNPFRHPVYAWTLWSHKILRWLSPYFLFAMLVSAIFLAGSSAMFQAASFFFAGLFFAAIIGYLAQRHQIAVPLVGTVYSFFLANAGFLVGTIQAVLGREITKYN